MILTELQIAKINELIDKYYNKFIVEHFGPSVLSADEFKRLSEQGGLNEILTLDDYVRASYLVGKLRNQAGTQAVKISLADFKRQLQQQMPELSTQDLLAIEAIRNKAGNFIKNLRDSTRASLEGVIRDANMNKQLGQLNEVIKPALERAVIENQDITALAKALRDKSGDIYRDWQRVAVSEMSQAYNQASVRAIADRNKHKSSDDVLTYCIGPVDGKICSECLRFYHDGGSFKLYRLSELQANGSNYGKKRNAWMPVIPPNHPNCRHYLVELPQGWTLDEHGVPDYVESDHHELNNNLAKALSMPTGAPRGLPMGTIRKWNKEYYIKTPNGWKHYSINKRGAKQVPERSDIATTLPPESPGRLVDKKTSDRIEREGKGVSEETAKKLESEGKEVSKTAHRDISTTPLAPIAHEQLESIFTSNKFISKGAKNDPNFKSLMKVQDTSSYIFTHLNPKEQEKVKGGSAKAIAVFTHNNENFFAKSIEAGDPHVADLINHSSSGMVHGATARDFAYLEVVSENSPDLNQYFPSKYGFKDNFFISEYFKDSTRLEYNPRIKIPVEDQLKLATTNIALMNFDRHSGNILVGLDNSVKLIDHNFTFVDKLFTKKIDPKDPQVMKDFIKDGVPYLPSYLNEKVKGIGFDHKLSESDVKIMHAQLDKFSTPSFDDSLKKQGVMPNQIDIIHDHIAKLRKNIKVGKTLSSSLDVYGHGWRNISTKPKLHKK